MRSRGLIVAIAIFVAGCTTTAGTKFDMAIIDSFQPQVTTKDDAVAKLGKPASLTNQPDGGTTLVWGWKEVGVSGGTAARVAILFNQDGKMVRIVGKSETNVR